MEDAKKPVPWLKLILEALIPPLMVFIWIWGVYAALALLLAQTHVRSQPSFVFSLLGWLKYAGEVAALFWFIFRMIRVVEARLRQWTATTDSKWDDVIVVLVVRALKLIVPLVGVLLVVPTLSQVWGDVIDAAQGDHLDVIGHFDAPFHSPPHRDWIATNSGFGRPDFERLWTEAPSGIDALERFAAGVAAYVSRG